MSEKDPNLNEEDASKLHTGGESEDADLESLFIDEEAPEGETAEEKVARMEKEMATMKKGVAKFFSERGRKERQPKKLPKSKRHLPIRRMTLQSCSWRASRKRNL